MSDENRLFRVIFHNQGQVYEIYACGVAGSNILGFVEVEALTFGERSQVVVDPAEEKLKREFEGVRRTYIPLHAVVRIDEVDRAGDARITDATGNVTPFPGQYYGPPGGGPSGGKI